MPGIRTSNSTKSGRTAAAFASASGPSRAVTTSKPSSRRLTSTKRRMSASSSATSTVAANTHPSLISLGAALRRRPFPDENRAGCPLTPGLLGRRRPLISRVLGAAPGPFTVALSTRIRFASRPAAPAGNRPVGSSERREAGVLEEIQETEEIIQRVAASGRGQGRADLLGAGPGPGQLGPAGAGGADLQDDDPLAAGHGRPAGRAGGDPGGDGGHQRLLEGGLLPAGSPRVRDLAGQCP